MRDSTEQLADAGLRRWAAAQTRAMGWPDDLHWEALRVEASNRRFYRVLPGGRPAAGSRSRAASASAPPTSLVVMDSPPDLENNTQFLRLAEVFARYGVGVPRIYAHESAAGWFLLADLGGNHLADAYLNQGPDAVMPAVLSTLHRIQQVRDPAVPAYTAQRFRDELDIFARWFVEEFLARPFPVRRLGAAFELLVSNTREQVQCCVHRDFHCRNLLVTPSGDIGVVDFQDALTGPVSYDLASLLRDCYYRFAEADVARWRNAYLAGTDLPLDPERFPRQLDLMAVQRQLKAVGIFARLYLRDGRSTHLPSIEPVLGQLTDLCARYPALAPLDEFLAEIKPAAEQRLEALLCGP